MHRRPTARRSASLAFVAVLVTLALPALHPGAWAHGIFDPTESHQVSDGPAGDGELSLREAHLRCPLCHALSQGRILLAAWAPTAAGKPAHAAGHVAAPPAWRLPEAPDIHGSGPRAPPRCA